MDQISDARLNLGNEYHENTWLRENTSAVKGYSSYEFKAKLSKVLGISPRKEGSHSRLNAGEDGNMDQLIASIEAEGNLNE